MFNEAERLITLKLVEIWYYLQSRGTHWPKVVELLENEINRRLGE